jgi:hypothetical protein
MDAKQKTAQVWRERVLAQQAAGQSVRGWCKTHGRHEHAFYWWRAKLGLSPALRMRRAAKPVRFAELVVDKPAVDAIRLRLGSGRELVLPATLAMTEIASLVRAIEGAA